jgi:hypothetical protein
MNRYEVLQNMSILNPTIYLQTSGLDANTARNVMEALREIARSGYAQSFIFRSKQGLTFTFIVARSSSLCIKYVLNSSLTESR